MSLPGVCHICGPCEDIAWCPRCEHWLCPTCRRNLAGRVLAAVFEAFAHRDDCCGPFVDADGRVVEAA